MIFDPIEREVVVFFAVRQTDLSCCKYLLSQEKISISSPFPNQGKKDYKLCVWSES